MFGTTAIWKSFRISDRGEKYGTGTYQSTNHTALGELATVCFYPVIEGKNTVSINQSHSGWRTGYHILLPGVKREKYRINQPSTQQLASWLPYIFFYPVLRVEKYRINQPSTQRLASWLPYSFYISSLEQIGIQFSVLNVSILC